MWTRECGQGNVDIMTSVNDVIISQQQKQKKYFTYDGLSPVLQILGMWITPSLPLLPGPLKSLVVVPVKSNKSIELFIFDKTLCNEHDSVTSRHKIDLDKMNKSN